MKKVEQKERLVRLRARGMPYSAIEKELGVTKKTLLAWERELREDIKKSKQWRLSIYEQSTGRISGDESISSGNGRNACTMRSERATCLISQQRS